MIILLSYKIKTDLTVYFFIFIFSSYWLLAHDSLSILVEKLTKADQFCVSVPTCLIFFFGSQVIGNGQNKCAKKKTMQFWQHGLRQVSQLLAGLGTNKQTNTCR